MARRPAALPAGRLPRPLTTIDLAYLGQAGRLKYGFVVHPGANPAQIRLCYSGAESVGLNADGQLDVTTPLGGFVDDALVAWQEVDDQRARVPAAFNLCTKPWPGPGRRHTIHQRLSAISHQPSAIRRPSPK